MKDSPLPYFSKVAVIGSGNIATWLVFALHKAGVRIVQIYSRNLEHAQSLAQSCQAQPIDQLNHLNPDLDLYIFSLKDDVYQTVIQQINFTMKCAVLTAGSVSQKLLATQSSNYGVLYPCQSISRGMNFDELAVPLCIEGNCPETVENLSLFAQKLSGIVYEIDEKQRQSLHIAAVFASNFTNAMYGIGCDMLEEDQINPEIIYPLLHHTLAKIERLSPWESQTGPARRNDKTIMQQHLSMIKNPQLQVLYQLISDYIIQKTKPQ